jgi:ribosome recycling factor
LCKLVGRRVEEGRIAVRNVRRDVQDDLRAFEKEKLITEDDLHVGREKLQELHDKFVKQMEEIGAAKEKEIMEV